jgi:hypothetical protein
MNWFMDWWSAIPAFERIFWLFAIPATILVLLQVIMTLVGLSHIGSDMDTDFDVDIDAGDFLDHFPIFSLRNFIAFFALFGWTGIAMNQAGFAPHITVLVALGAGMTSMVLMTLLFKFMMSLASSGNVDIRDAIGKNGVVYLKIPAKMNDYGKVTITVADKSMEYNAVTIGEEIQTNAMVKVIDVMNGKLVVERI